MSKNEPGRTPALKIPMKDVEGKVAFITGGASGIGLGIGRAFVDAGMKVVIASRSERNKKPAMEFLGNARERVHFIRVDVTDRPGMEKAAAETVEVFGKVHVLVNNAGVIVPRTVSQTRYEDWDWLMNVNLTGVFNGIHAFLPLIQSHGEGGHIISTSSTLGLFVWGSAEGIYTASKFAVTALMETLRAELLGTDIGVSVFCPGWVRTNLGFSSREAYPGDPNEAGFKQDLEEIERLKKTIAKSELFMDPLEVGQLMLRGMRRNDLYILTHAEWEPLMRKRHEAQIAALPKDLHPNEARSSKAREMTQASIYTSELTRTRC